MLSSVLSDSHVVLDSLMRQHNDRITGMWAATHVTICVDCLHNMAMFAVTLSVTLFMSTVQEKSFSSIKKEVLAGQRE